MVRRLNIKLIALFSFALWLFHKAGEILGYLRDPVLAEQIRQAKGQTTVLSSEGFTTTNIIDLALASGFAGFIGLLVGLTISLIICRRNRLHWLNPCLASIIVYLIGWLKTANVDFVGQFLRKPGEAFGGVWYYLINGFVSILLGLLTLALIGSLRRPNHNLPVTIKSHSH